MKRPPFVTTLAALLGLLLSACGGYDPYQAGSGGAPSRDVPTFMSEPPAHGLPPEEHFLGLGVCATFSRGLDRIDVCQRHGETVASANCAVTIARLIFNGSRWLDREETLSVDRLGEGGALVKIHRAKGATWSRVSSPSPCP